MAGGKVVTQFAGYVGSFATLNGITSMNVTDVSLIWAAMTVGAPSLSVALRSVADSVPLAIHKAMAMLAVTDWSDLELRIPRSYSRLDPSEKSNLAYWMGMAMTKMMAEEFFRVPWLQHLGTLRSQKRLRVAPPDTKILPDLAGLDGAGNWHVFEAKGRQRKPGSKQITEWKQQACTVVEIEGQAPLTSSYCCSLMSNPYSITAADPLPDPSRQAVRLQFGRRSFLKAYYEPFLAFLREREVVEVDGVRFAPAVFDPLHRVEYQVGLEPRVLEWAQDGQHLGVGDARPIEGGHIGSDGIAVRMIGPRQG